MMAERAFMTTDVARFRNIDRPRYSKPTQIGAFSLDINGEFSDNDSSLKYYYRAAEVDVKRRGFDLNIGCDQYLAEEEIHETRRLPIDNLLKWIVRHRGEITREEAKVNLWCDFVCWRGLLTRLLSTMRVTGEQSDDEWIIAVTLYRGTYYLCEYETEKRNNDRRHPPRRQAEMCYWGHKFEQYCVTDSPTVGPQDPQYPLSIKEQYCSVVTSKLNQHRLLFGGEVDCCDPSNREHYIELKTNRIFTAPRQHQSFCRFKAFKWWAQSFLIGIQEIIAGFRDDDGIVRNFRSYPTQELLSMAKSGETFEPGLAFTFTHSLLNFIKETVTIDDPRAVCVFRYEVNTAGVSAQLYPGPSEWTFLPDWYINDP